MDISTELVINIIENYFIGMVTYIVFVGILDGILEENTEIKLKQLLMYPVAVVYSLSKITTSIVLRVLKAIFDRFI